MPQSPENNNQSTIQQAADQHAEEVLARRRESRASRASALAAHPRPLSIKTELTQVPLAAAPGSAPVSTTTQTAGYLLAVGDSWFDYPIHDILTRLDDNYGYNIESSAHRGDTIETMASRVGQLDTFARCMDKIVALGATPKAILISGGGDDIAGTEFGMLINNIDLLPIPGWNDQVVAGVVDTRIAAAYRLSFYPSTPFVRRISAVPSPFLCTATTIPSLTGAVFSAAVGCCRVRGSSRALTRNSSAISTQRR
jgi:hypothetical protein